MDLDDAFICLFLTLNGLLFVCPLLLKAFVDSKVVLTKGKRKGKI